MRCILALQIQGVTGLSEGVNEGDAQTNDHALQTSLVPLAHRTSLVSWAHHTFRRYNQFIYILAQYFSNCLHQFPARRRPSNHLSLLCQVHYSRVRHLCFQTLPPYFKPRVFNASLTMCRHHLLNNPTLLEPKSTQRWRIIMPKPTSVQVHYLSDLDVHNF